MEQDIANLFNDVYSLSAPAVLGAQHNFLLESIKKQLAERPGNLLVLGCGAQALPYSVHYDGRDLGGSRAAEIDEMIGEHSIVLADYSLEGLRRARSNLAKAGFFDHRNDYGIQQQFHKIPPRSILFLRQDLNDGIKVDAEQFSAVDANLSTHHVTAREQDIERLYADVRRVLVVGGILHLGEGNVDMGHSEEKIGKMQRDLSSLMGQDVKIIDQRDRERVFGDGRLEARIDGNGMVYLPTPHARIVKKQLNIAGYRQVIATDDQLVLPLIDPEMPCDQQHIMKVNTYYAEITALAFRGYRDRQELLEGLEKGIADERGKARRGIVEYYRSPRLLQDKLEKTGFLVENVKYHDGPFYNMIARRTANCSEQYYTR